MGTFGRILALVGGREEALGAVKLAAELALRDGAELALLAVVDVRLTHAAEAGIPSTELLASLRHEARACLLVASLNLPPELHPTELLREGRPAEEIVAAARAWGADLIVLGAARAAGLGRLLADGTADDVAHRAPCPVLLVRPEPVIAVGGLAGWRPFRGWSGEKETARRSDTVVA